MERSNLYLKLFKLVFGSVSLFPAENEQMLKVCSWPVFRATKAVSITYNINKIHLK